MAGLICRPRWSRARHFSCHCWIGCQWVRERPREIPGLAYGKYMFLPNRDGRNYLLHLLHLLRAGGMWSGLQEMKEMKEMKEIRTAHSDLEKHVFRPLIST